MTATLPLWRNPRYLVFFSAFTIGNIGDWFDMFALQIIFAHKFGASPIIIGLLFAIYILPGAVIGPLCGGFVDRFRQKKYLLIVTDLACAALTVGLILSSNIWLALILLLVRSSLAGVNNIGQNVVLKHIVNDDQLLTASSFSSIVLNLCKIIGPLLGAFIVAAYSAETCLGINAISFLVSAVILLFLTLAPTDLIDKTIATKRKWLHDMQAGWQIIMDSPTLRTMLLLILPAFFFILMAEAQTVILLRHIVPSQPDLLGKVLGVSAIGSVLTGVKLSRQKQLTDVSKTLAIALLLMALGYFGMGIYQAQWSEWWLFFAAFIQGCSFGITSVTYGYVLRHESPPDAIGRVYGIGSMLLSTLMVLGSLAGGGLSMLIGVRGTFMTVVIVTILLCGAALYVKRRQRH